MRHWSRSGHSTRQEGRGEGKEQADRHLKFKIENGLGMDGQPTKKAALRSANAALILGEISHSLHGPVFVVVRARPADVLADVKGHGFDFASRLPARPGEHKPAGVVCQIKAAFAGGKGLAGTPIGERGHFRILSWVGDMVSMGGFVHVRDHNMGLLNSSFKRIEFMDNIRDID